MDGILQQGPGALASGMDEDFEGWRVGGRTVRLEAHPLGRLHRLAVPRQAAHGVAVVGEVTGPRGQHLPWPDGVQFLHIGEEKDADVSPPVGHRLIQPGPANARLLMVGLRPSEPVISSQ